MQDRRSNHEGATLVGYASLIESHSLKVVRPETLSLISNTFQNSSGEKWRSYSLRYKPQDTLKGHLTFALKYEGIDLAILKALFTAIDPNEIEEIVRSEPTGAYSRRIWFLYEWLCEAQLDLEYSGKGNYVPLINEKLQYPGPSRKSKRHMVRNNLPGTLNFCPIIRRTPKLDSFIQLNLDKVAYNHIDKLPTSSLGHAARHFSYEESKASYAIEGESPPLPQILRWGQEINEASQRPLSIKELEHLQAIALPKTTDIHFGLRCEGGFIGHHSRDGQPHPVHISAQPKDLQALVTGMIETSNLLQESEFDTVLTASLIAFGFVFIHPFEDGNGRIHRYLIHHSLAESKFIPYGLVLPLSTVILNRINDYRITLEHYSWPRLEQTKWQPTKQGNVEVLNDTIDLYRYFDATKQAEFLYECLEEAINKILPEDLDYVVKYGKLRNFIKSNFDIPDPKIGLLINHLIQNNGTISKSTLPKEFTALTPQEATSLQQHYIGIVRV